MNVLEKFIKITHEYICITKYRYLFHKKTPIFPHFPKHRHFLFTLSELVIIISAENQK